MSSTVALSDLMDIAEDCARYVVRGMGTPAVYFVAMQDEPNRFNTGRLPAHPCVHPKDLLRMLLFGLSPAPTSAVLLMKGTGSLEELPPELEVVVERAHAGDEEAKAQLADLPGQRPMIALLGETSTGERQHRLFLVEGERGDRRLTPAEALGVPFISNAFPFFGMDLAEATVTALHALKHGLEVEMIVGIPANKILDRVREEAVSSDWIDNLFSEFVQTVERKGSRHAER